MTTHNLALKSEFAGAVQTRWSEAEANAWYAEETRYRRISGSNYVPAYAINQLEMWQADTFDPERIDLELGWAEKIGNSTMRVFLHDLLWQQDSRGFTDRLDTFLAISAKHKIKPIFVLFDSCWDPDPVLGPQKKPVPGVHNSGWVQGPGVKTLKDPSQIPRLRDYVEGVIGAFSTDRRILAWDIWNEPCNSNPAYCNVSEHIDTIVGLLPQVFHWARTAGASQPLTSGVWTGDLSAHDRLSAMAKAQLEESDIVTFHSYEVPEEFEERLVFMKRYNRPVICTEFIGRQRTHDNRVICNDFANTLPILEKHDAGGIMWGFVAGASQTNHPWDSWHKPYVGNHKLTQWFHDLLHEDGRPYCPKEYALYKSFAHKKSLLSVAPSQGNFEPAVP